MKGLFLTLAWVAMLTGIWGSNPAIGGSKPSPTEHKPVSGQSWVLDTNAVQPAVDEKIPGFRVQLYQGSSRTKAKEIRDLTVKAYPKLGVYMVFRQPDFRVRVGDFRDKGEATTYLNLMKSDFPSAFVVPDKVLLYPKAAREEEPSLEQDGFED
jgi:hypothetical protein